MKIAIEVKPTPAGEDGDICYENGETIDIPIVAAIMLRVRRVVDLCRQADFIKRALYVY